MKFTMPTVAPKFGKREHEGYNNMQFCGVEEVNFNGNKENKLKFQAILEDAEGNKELGKLKYNYPIFDKNGVVKMKEINSLLKAVGKPEVGLGEEVELPMTSEVTTESGWLKPIQVYLSKRNKTDKYFNIPTFLPDNASLFIAGDADGTVVKPEASNADGFDI